jgi:hypothetical protein
MSAGGLGASFLLSPVIPIDRFVGACAAARAGQGAGNDGQVLTANQRAAWRQQARVWLRADLDEFARLLDSNLPEEGGTIAQSLRRLRSEPDLATIRDRECLADLPASERRECQAIWDAVDALLARIVARQKPIDL